MTELVEKTMRETIAACAVDAYRRRRPPYKCSNYPGRDKDVQSLIEKTLSDAAERSNRRERDFYEEKFAAYAGDPRHLPWRRAEARQRRLDEERRARLAMNA